MTEPHGERRKDQPGRDMWELNARIIELGNVVRAGFDGVDARLDGVEEKVDAIAGVWNGDPNGPSPIPSIPFRVAVIERRQSRLSDQAWVWIERSIVGGIGAIVGLGLYIWENARGTGK